MRRITVANRERGVEQQERKVDRGGGGNRGLRVKRVEQQTKHTSTHTASNIHSARKRKQANATSFFFS